MLFVYSNEDSFVEYLSNSISDTLVIHITLGLKGISLITLGLKGIPLITLGLTAIPFI